MAQPVSSLSSPFSFHDLPEAHCGHLDHRVAVGHGLRPGICPHRGLVSVSAVDLIVRLCLDTLDLAGAHRRHAPHRRRAAFPSNGSLLTSSADRGHHDLVEQETGFLFGRPSRKNEEGGKVFGARQVGPDVNGDRTYVHVTGEIQWHYTKSGLVRCFPHEPLVACGPLKLRR